MSGNPRAGVRQFDTSAGRLFILTALFVLLSGLGTYVIYSQFAGRNITFDSRLLAWPTLLAVGSLLCVYFVADGLRLYFTLRALGHSVGLRRIFPLVFINIFFSNITPMATGGGLAQVWYLQRYGVRIGTALAATTIRTALAMLFIFALTPVFLLTLNVLTNHPLLDKVILVLALLILFYLGLFIVMLARARWLIAPLTVLLGMTRRARLISSARHRRWQYKARREMLQLSRSFAVYLHGGTWDVLLSVLFTVVFLLSLFSFPALLIYSLGYEVSYIVTVGLLVVTTFIMYVSPTPGGSGITEGIFGSFFNEILTANHLVLVTLGWRFLTIYFGMLIGLVLVQRQLLRSKKTT